MAYFQSLPVFTEGRHTGEYIKSEANWMRSRDNAILAAGSGPCPAGTVLGKVAIGTPAAPVATAGNTGNGTVSAVAIGAKARVGTYTIAFTGPTAYEVRNPDGDQLAEGGAGAYADPEIGFTFTAGGTAMVAGDTITVAIPAGSLKLTPTKAGALDGSQVACAILYAAADATSVDVPVAVTARDTEIFSLRLTFDPSIAGTPALVAAALAELGSKAIVAR